ncbi:V-type ATP synthase subunit E [Clostridium hydrogeniformans]|uniref:V-type ATP synthase subunit E n=1 Tax=Clostridium hydrogeniformans TaxID=349933 RepID=UPI0004816AAD|nr:V-type ATP synthase subunit E [Clostridium hydrogeniformans]
MSNLNNITSKILGDAKAKSDEILEEAKKDEQKIIDKKVNEANLLKASTIEKANREAKVKKERVISSAELQCRNESLKAKGQIIDKVLNKSLEELKNLPVEKFNSIFNNFIVNMDIEGDEEVIVPEAYKAEIKNSLKETNKSLSAKGKKGELKLYEGEREISSGFILSKNGIYVNMTFESLLSYNKDDLEQEIVKALFN